MCYLAFKFLCLQDKLIFTMTSFDAQVYMSTYLKGFSTQFSCGLGSRSSSWPHRRGRKLLHLLSQTRTGIGELFPSTCLASICLLNCPSSVLSLDLYLLHSVPGYACSQFFKYLFLKVIFPVFTFVSILSFSCYYQQCLIAYLSVVVRLVRTPAFWPLKIHVIPE